MFLGHVFNFVMWLCHVRDALCHSLGEVILFVVLSINNVNFILSLAAVSQT